MAEEEEEEAWKEEEEEEEVKAKLTSQGHPFQAGTQSGPASSFWISFGYPFRPKQQSLLPING